MTCLRQVVLLALLLSLAWIGSASGGPTCDATCECGLSEWFACTQYCDASYSALCMSGTCNGMQASCCCQQYTAAGINYFCTNKRCGYIFPNEAHAQSAPPKRSGAPAPSSPSASQERWAVLEYRVGSNLELQEIEATSASDTAFASKIVQAARDKRLQVPRLGPGLFRVFQFEPPMGRPTIHNRESTKALKALMVPLAPGSPPEAMFALRLELAADGTLLRSEEIFSTEPGLSEPLALPVGAYLAQAGFQQAGKPLVVVLFFRAEDGRVGAVSQSNYIP